ncbi:MAG: MFS transporter [Rhodothermales bacterium]
MNLSDRPRLRLLTLCALYLVQGIPTGFVTITLAAFLAERGASAAQIATFVAVGWLPWGVKLFFGPLVDRFAHSAMGRRRPWILGAEAGMITVLATMIAVPDLADRLLVLTGLVFVGNLFNALQDVATDGMAVDLLRPEERGLANGAMWSAKILGIAIGGAGMSTVMASSGLRAALTVQLTFT